MREFFLNADFDLSLGGRPPLMETSDAAYLREMAWHFLFAADPEDTVIILIPLPEGFRRYAADKGLALPRTVAHPAFTPAAEFTPFGWNAQAKALAARYARSPRIPDLAIVKTANSRAFALGLEMEAGNREGRLYDDIGSLSAFLAARDPAEAWVAKGDHGYAGTANRRVPGGPLSPGDAARLAPLFADHGRVVLEPWHARLADMAALFTIPERGPVADFRGHTLLNSRDGAFLGVEVPPDRLPPAPWREAMREHAGRLAAALQALGYAGPVGVDAYVHAAPEGPRLRPGVDINARLSMALPAHGLARRLPGRYVRWSWHKPRKLRLPSDYAGLEARLGDSAFDPAAREGILAVSPLFREDDPALRPKRIGFALVAADPAGLERLQAAFARALGRGP